MDRTLWLIKETDRCGGLAPVDIDRFWADQAVAMADPFGARIPQAPCGVLMSGECVYDELGIPEDYRRYEHDETWRLEMHRAYNDRAEKIVGRRLLTESPSNPELRWPAVKNLGDIFEAETVWHDEARSWWLHESAHDERELRALLDRVERRLDNLRAFLLPPDWDREKDRLRALGAPPPRYMAQRGPVTFATSIYGVENLLYLIMDNEKLAGRFRDLILRAILGMARVMNDEAAPEPAARGFYFSDDNCCLLNPAMYEFFGYPILEGVFAQVSPDPGDARFQHSDSAMGHLLPLLGRLKLTSVNFGPTLAVARIREHLPLAVIHGQLAPFTFSRDDREGIVRELLRDFEGAREKRGWVFETAGSINNGSRLTGMRLIMSAIQHFARFD